MTKKSKSKRIRTESDIENSHDSSNKLESTTIFETIQDKVNVLLAIENPSTKQVLEGIGCLLQLLIKTTETIKNSNKSFNEKIRNTSTHIVDLKKAHNALLTDFIKTKGEINVLQQQRISNEIIVSGFPNKPDPTEAVNKICENYNIQIGTISSAYSYEVDVEKSINDGDLEKKVVKMGFLVISFYSKNAQIQFNMNRKAKGPMYVKQIFTEASDEIGNTKLVFKFKLIKAYRALNYDLNNLRNNNIIKSFKYRNGRFTLTTNTDDIVTVAASEEIANYKLALEQKLADELGM